MDRGIFGAFYIAISILLVPRLGAATFIAILVAGQMLCSLVIDHYGPFWRDDPPGEPFTNRWRGASGYRRCPHSAVTSSAGRTGCSRKKRSISRAASGPR